MALTQITTNGIKDGTITNADIGSSAAIAGSKISPNFGSQNITTTGTLDTGIATLNRADITVVTDGSRNNGVFIEAGDTGQGNRPNLVLKGAGSAGLSQEAIQVYYDNGSTKSFDLDYQGNIEARHADFSAGIDVTGNITTTGDIRVPDDKSLFFGGSDDFQLLHRSADNISIIKEVGGSDLSIETNGSKAQFYDSVNGRNMAEFNVGGACLFKHGATTRLATNSTGATVTGNLDVTSGDVKLQTDNKSIQFGASADLSMKHDGTNSYILNNTGSFIISADTIQFNNRANNETKAKFINNGGVELYHNGTKSFETDSTGINVFGTSGNGIIDIVPVGSAVYSILNFHNVGQSSNAQIISVSGSNILMGSGGSGSVTLRTANSQNKVVCNHDGSVDLYHGSSKKFETTSAGAAVTGDITATGSLSITSAATINGLVISSTNDNTRATMELNGKDSSGNQVELRLGGFGDTNRGEIFTETNHPIGFATNNTSAQMVLDTSGRLIVGATSGAGKFIVQDSSLPKIQANFNGAAHLESGVGGSGGGFAITTGHFLTFNHQPYANRGTDTNLTERYRIDSEGVMVYGPFASFAYNNITGLFNLHSGARVNTGGSGQYAAAKGGFVDNSRFELENKLITVGGSQQIIQAHNGAPLKITNSRNNWSYYNNLPNYLLGHPATDCINLSNYSVTLRATMTVFLQRTNGWNSVPLTGWELLESDTNIYPGNTDSRLYVKTFAAGSYTFDSDSAMYFFML